MNKMAKILSAVLSVTLVLGVTVAMLVSAFAASAPKFSVNVVSETKDEVVVALNLEDGSFTALDLQVNASDWENATKTTGLSISKVERGSAYKEFNTQHENDDAPPMMAVNSKNGQVGFACVTPYDAKGQMVLFTFTKTASAKEKIVASDIVVTISSCNGADNAAVTPVVSNNIPAEVVTTTTTTTTKKADVTTTTTKKADVTTTTTEKADVTTTTTEKADVTTTTTEKADVTTTTTEKADDTTTATEATKADDTTAATEATTEATKADDTTAATEATTEATKADDTTAATEATTEATKADDTTAKADDTTAADASTTAPAADTTTAATGSDVVNPETGDRLTATAAVVSLLAISGAAVVALRKKED